MKNIAQLIGEDRKSCSDVSTESSRRDSPAPQPLFLSLPRHARASHSRGQDSPAGGVGRAARRDDSAPRPPLSFPASLSRWPGGGWPLPPPPPPRRRRPRPGSPCARNASSPASSTSTCPPPRWVAGTPFLTPTFQESRGGRPSRVSIALFPCRRRWSTRQPTTSPSSGSRSCEPRPRPPARPPPMPKHASAFRCV